MPGWSNADNKYGLTPYVVGQTLGDGCNYSSIQSAIDDAFAAGGGVVGIRPGTYTENLTLRAGVDLYGFSVDGRVPSPISNVVIEGNHTFSIAVGFGASLAQYITFRAAAGDIFTITAAAATQAVLAQKFCGLEAFTVPGQRCVVMDATATGGCQYSTDNVNLSASGHVFEGIGAGSHEAFVGLGNVNSQSGNVFESTSGSNNLSGQYTTMNGALRIFNGTVGGSLTCLYTNLFCPDEIAFFPAGIGSIDLNHCTASSSAASGFWVDGIAGALVSFSDLILGGSAQATGPALTVTHPNWQPYGEAAAGSVGSNRGTASFNNLDFTVTDGFVSLSGSTSGAVTQLDGDTGSATPTSGVITIQGGAGVTTSAGGSILTVSSVEWQDIAAPTLAVVDTGYFDFGPTTLTLPAAPSQGEQVRVFSINSPTVVQANVGQTIQIGNLTSSNGGTATGNDTGDCLVLVYYAVATRWCAESVVGNWTLA